MFQDKSTQKVKKKNYKYSLAIFSPSEILTFENTKAPRIKSIIIDCSPIRADNTWSSIVLLNINVTDPINNGPITAANLPHMLKNPKN